MSVEPDESDETTDRTGPMRVLLSAAFWIYLATSSALFYAGALLLLVVTGLFDRRRAILHLYTCFWGYHYVVLSPFWTVRFDGRERIPKGASMMVVNHQSLGDILVLFGLYRQFKWVSKASVFKVPFIGWNMTLNDYVRLVRGDRASIETMLDDCRTHMRRGSAIMMFPEGTRSRDGEIKEFKHGAFSLAAELGVPVVPIVCNGTMNALPKSGWVMRNGARLKVRVEVLPSIDPEAFDRDPERLRHHTRAQMIDALARLRRSSEHSNGARAVERIAEA